jgi:hypothetical protein
LKLESEHIVSLQMFAYGQTGAGKSFSMMGDSSEEGAGIIPRMASKLLQRLREKRDAGTDVTLQVRTAAFSSGCSYRLGATEKYASW